MGVPGAADPKDRPAGWLKSIITKRTEQLLKTGVSKESAAFLESVPHELTAIDYVSNDDLQETVYLDRLWLKVLGASAAKQDPSSSGQVTAILESLNDSEDRRYFVG